MNAWCLAPEHKTARAQEAQRGVVARVTALLTRDAMPEMQADDLEVLALQFKLAAVNLMVSARELREAAAEREMLRRELQREAGRYEPEQAGSLCHEGRDAA